VAGYLEDLDELVLKCRNEKAQDHIREAVACYRAGSYRSAVVSCWVAVCFDIIEKLRELSLAGDQQAKKKIQELDSIHNKDDLRKAMNFEKDILDVARNEIELISAIEHTDLDRIREDRHRCAHPALNAEGEQYNPPAELARLHIHSAVTHLLQHEPAQGKRALDYVIKRVNSKFFPTGEKEVLSELKNTSVYRGRKSLIENFITYLMKKLFLKTHDDYRLQTKIISCLVAVNKIHPKIYEGKVSNIFTTIFERVPDDELAKAVMNIPEIPFAWESLMVSQQQRIQKFVENLPSDHFYFVQYFLDFEPFEKFAEQRLKIALFSELRRLFLPGLYSDIDDRISNRLVDLLRSAGSFNDSRALIGLIREISDGLSDDAINLILKNLDNNKFVKSDFDLQKLIDSLKGRVCK